MNPGAGPLNELAILEPGILPEGIRSRFVENVNGLRMHVLEAGFETSGRPCLLLLHGFPELAYSWRKVMSPLAAAGYHVIAPDQRGYGRTTGWSSDYDSDLTPFNMVNLVRDTVALLQAMGISTTAAVAGHDFGSSVAAYCALIRPDMFPAVALMSAPFAGVPRFPFNTDHGAASGAETTDIFEDLAKLERPRKHYHRYYSTREANKDMLECPQGVADFLRGYFHSKSADWAGNDPKRLDSWTASELAKMPTYYIMDLAADMAEIAANFMPSESEIAACRWLTDVEIQFYGDEFSRTGFQGGLQWYRCRFDPAMIAELKLYSGKTIDVPSCFIGGEKDWGVFQRPGSFEAMQGEACTRMSSAELVSGAGHWVQQERPDVVVQLLTEFLSSL